MRYAALTQDDILETEAVGKVWPRVHIAERAADDFKGQEASQFYHRHSKWLEVRHGA